MANLRVQRRRASGTDRGASLVEFALILPVFAMLLFGMLTAGLALNEKQQMTHATREGARYAATVPVNQTFADAGTWANNVRSLIVERSTGSLSSSDICVSLVKGNPGVVVSPSTQYTTLSTGGPCIPNQPHPTSGADDGLRVQVTSSKPGTIDLVLFGRYDVNLDARATAVSESRL